MESYKLYKNEIELYIPNKNQLTEMYGNIKVGELEKKFASAKCCMCCQ